MKINKFLIILSGLFFFTSFKPSELPDEIDSEISDSITLEEITEIPIEESEILTDSIESYELVVPIYDNWEVATIQGKLKMKGLPVSPSLKIFMKRDSLISVSVRAPFVGEAGRLDITPDTLIAVNKLKNTYLKEKLNLSDKLLGIGERGLSINDFQDLILGRFFIPGFDLEETELEEIADIYPEEDLFNIVPKGKAEIEGLKYGYTVDSECNPLLLMILPQFRDDIELSINYTYNLQGYNIDIQYVENSHLFEIIMELKDAQFSGETPKPIEIGKKYKEVSLGEFLRF